MSDKKTLLLLLSPPKPTIFDICLECLVLTLAIAGLVVFVFATAFSLMIMAGILPSIGLLLSYTLGMILWVWNYR